MYSDTVHYFKFACTHRAVVGRVTPKRGAGSPCPLAITAATTAQVGVKGRLLRLCLLPLLQSRLIHSVTLADAELNNKYRVRVQVK
jgi:hypothetical protein